ncbi:MAG: serine hydrolase [Pseudomonadota bacterium]
MQKVSVRIARLMLLCVALLLAAVPSSSHAQATEDTFLAARLDALAEGFMLREQVPGAIATVVSGEITILRGYGHSDIKTDTPVNPDGTRFEIGSITKLFTWFAVMLLVEEGAVGLQDDLTPLLPEGLVPGDTPLTLAHLMSHRPGLEESFAIFDETVSGLPKVEALYAAAPDQVFPRGEVTSYSNWGVALAGLVVEQLSGEPWELFVETRILVPLSMDATTTGEARRQAAQPHLSESYRVQGGVAHPAFRIDLGAFAPAGSIASTAADMERFLRFIMGDGSLDGVRLLQPETMASMRTRLFNDRPNAADMAYGLQSRPVFGTMVYGHGGGLNEFLSMLVFIPEIEAGIFVSQNGGTGASVPLLLPDLILAELMAEAGFQSRTSDPVSYAAEHAADSAGLYLTNRRPFSGRAQFFGALSPLAVTATADGALLIQTNKVPAPSRFEAIGPDLWQSELGDRVAFFRDHSGQVFRMADGTGAHTYERANGLSNPLWLYAAFGLAGLLSISTLVALLWRHGLTGGSRIGTLASIIEPLASITFWAFVAAAGASVIAAIRLGSEYIFDQPQPTSEVFFLSADIVVVIATLLAVSQLLVWRASGWSVLRRLHASAFAAAMAIFGALLLYWGLAFSGPI